MLYPLEDSVIENKQFQEVKDTEVKEGVLIQEKDCVKDNLCANEEEKLSVTQDVDFIVQLEGKSIS